MEVINIDLAYRLILFLSTIGILISTLEMLVYREQLRNSGLSSWSVLGIRPRLRFPPATKIGDQLFGYPGVLGVLFARLMAIAITWAFLSNPYVLIISVPVMFVTTWMLSNRNPFGNDGSDQMNIIVLTICTVHALIFRSTPIAMIGLIFIASQAILSYFVAGVAKLRSPKWRSGTAMFAVMNTRCYGCKPIAGLLERATLLQLLAAWTVIGFETSFPIALVLGPKALVCYLVIAGMFHAGCAIFMGLNSFFWAFVATYPAVLYCGVLLSNNLATWR